MQNKKSKLLLFFLLPNKKVMPSSNKRQHSHTSKSADCNKKKIYTPAKLFFQPNDFCPIAMEHFLPHRQGLGVTWLLMHNHFRSKKTVMLSNKMHHDPSSFLIIVVMLEARFKPSHNQIYFYINAIFNFFKTRLKFLLLSHYCHDKRYIKTRLSD